MSNSGRPSENEYGEFFAGYVNKVDSNDIVGFLQNQHDKLQATFGDLPEDQASVVHSPYTWTIKQVLGHLIDGEKVFGYRLHRIACGDKTPLPGFDHEPYVDQLPYDIVTCSDLLKEFLALRESNIRFLKRLPADAWQRSGTASDCEFTVLGKAFVLAGHVQHHYEIIQQRISAKV